MSLGSDQHIALTGGPSDERLLARVRPPGWKNPPPREPLDLLVIGGGTAGLVSAHMASALGARVALVERELLGGDCLVTGCVPSKALIASAREAHAVRRAGGEFDSRAAFERMRSLRADIAAHDSAERLRDAGVDVHFGEARFVANDAVGVAGQRLRFRRAIVATGARPRVPDIPGIADVPVLTSESVFALESAPGSLVVIGGGPIGCELAQAFARMGTEVTMLVREGRLLPRDDADAADIILAALTRDGVRVMLDARIACVRPSKKGVEVLLDSSSGRGTQATIEAAALLAATGRAPMLDPLALDSAGIATVGGLIRVDDKLRTSNPRVLAAGDACSRHQFTHVAEAMARIAVQNALLTIGPSLSALALPWCTYTDPEVAHVGMTSEEASLRDDVIELTMPLDRVDRAILEGTTTGYARLAVERKSGRVLGGTMVSSHAGESIGLVALAVRRKLTAADLDATVLPYPTEADAIRRAATPWLRGRLKPWMPRLIRRWLDLRG